MPKTVGVVVLVLALAALVPGAPAGDTDEEAAIKKVALEYAEAWYAADADRMERAVHADLVHRHVTADPKTGKNHLEQLSGLGVVEATRAGVGKRVPKDAQVKEATLLDRYGTSA